MVVINEDDVDDDGDDNVDDDMDEEEVENNEEPFHPCIAVLRTLPESSPEKRKSWRLGREEDA